MTAPVLPAVSVIMPVHNAAAFLADTVASVQAQTLENWELLAVDDGSTDGSGEILAELSAKDPRIRLLATKGKQGAGKARNCAIDAARGQWLAFLDADDLWLPEKLTLQLEAMENAGVPFSCTAYIRHDLSNGRKTEVGVPFLARRADLLKTNTVACSTAVVKRDLVGLHRMSDMPRRQDFLFWTQLLTATPAVLGLPQPLMVYRQHPSSLSAPKSRAAANTWAMYRKALDLPLHLAVWYFGNYALRGTLRHHFPHIARRIGVLHQVEPPTAKGPAP